LFIFISFSFCPTITHAKDLFQYERIDFFGNRDIQDNPRQTISNEVPETIVDEWAEPITSSSGRISIYLPPKEVRSFLENPDSENAKAYLQWNSRRIKKFIAAQEALKKETGEIEIMKETKNQADSVGDNKPRANYLFYFMRKGCPYCAKETPIIENIYLAHPEIKIEAFAKGFSDQELSKFKFPVMQDKGMSRLLKLTSYPAIAIFNKKKERYLLTGFVEKDKILKLFE
jgi:thioredoxin-related protein